jgi:hypothetical protein
MKTSTMRLMIATAALTVAACSASAQTLKAEIPMSFRVAGTLMAPGSYEVRQVNSTGRTYVHLRNLNTYASVLLAQGVKSDPPKTWRQDGSPRIGFACLGGSCMLSQLWNGQDDFAFNFPAPKPRPADVVAQQMTFVTLAMIKVH